MIKYALQLLIKPSQLSAIRRNTKKYRVNEYNMEKEFKKIKATARSGGMSTDDEDVISRVRKAY